LKVYTVGIGYNTSHSTIRNIAKAGHGAHEFCTPEEIIEPKMERMFRRITSSLQNVRIDWGNFQDHRSTVGVIPVIQHSRVILYALLKEKDLEEFSIF
jgi:hypothetical protein